MDCDGVRRLFIAAGSAEFNDISTPPLECVPEELESISSQLNAFGYERNLAEQSLNPTKAEFAQAVSTWFQGLTDTDIAILYYSSHGESDHDRYYLLTTDSMPCNPDVTSIPAEELGRWISKNVKASQVLVIVDACYSATGGQQLAAAVNNILTAINSGLQVYVISAARSRQEASQSVLASAFQAALSPGREYGGPTQEYLGFDDVIAAINDHLKAHYPKQTAVGNSVNVMGRFKFFRNPNFQRGIPSGLDIERQKAMLEHWIPKAKGANVDAGTWYFTGRQNALDELIQWLNSKSGDTRPRIITGGPGSGKSALLSRLVTTSALSINEAPQPDSWSQAPLVEGEITAAIHLRQKTLGDVVELLAATIGLPAEDAPQLLNKIETLEGETVIIFDALDEAEERDEILHRLIAPLSGRTGVRLLIGTRPDVARGRLRFSGLGEKVVEIDLDTDAYYNQDDVATYVERRLLAEDEPDRPTPYRNKQALASEVARAVAARAHFAFLAAHTVVQSLLSMTEPVDTSIEGWVDQLPTGIDSAFDAYVEALIASDSDLSRARVMEVLAPLAFAFGEGLPWSNIWPAMAGALANANISDSQVSTIFEKVAAFVIESLEDNRSVYRLCHEALAEHLRAQFPNTKEVHRKLTQSLIELVPHTINKKLMWLNAHPYIRSHMADHAVQCGMLDKLIQDPVYLLAAEPYRLSAALSKDFDHVSYKLMSLYRRASHHLRSQNTSESAAYLEFIGRRLELQKFADEISNLPLPRAWKNIWLHWEERGASQVLARGTSPISALEVYTSSAGTPAVIIGREDGSIEGWDLEFDRCLFSWRPEGSSGVKFLSIQQRPEGPFIAISWFDGQFGWFDPVRGEKQAVQHFDFDERVTAQQCVTTKHGKSYCITAHFNNQIKTWSLPELKEIAVLESNVAPAAYHFCPLPIEDENHVAVLAACDPIHQNINFCALSVSPLSVMWSVTGNRTGIYKHCANTIWNGRHLALLTPATIHPVEIWDIKSQMLMAAINIPHADASWFVEDGEHTYFLVSELECIRVYEISSAEASEDTDIQVRPVSQPQVIQGTCYTDIIDLFERPVLLSSVFGYLRAWDVRDLIQNPDFAKDTEQNYRVSARLSHNCSKNEKILFHGYRDTVSAFNWQSGVKAWEVEIPGNHVCASLAYSEKKNQLYIGTRNGTIYTARGDGSLPFTPFIKAGESLGPIRCIEWQGRPLLIVSCFLDLEWAVKVFDAATGVHLGHLGKLSLSHGEEDKEILGLDVCDCGDSVRVVFSSKYGKIMMSRFDESGVIKSKVTFRDYEEWRIPGASVEEYVSALAVARDGSVDYVASGTHEKGDLCIWQRWSQERPATQKKAHAGGISCITFIRNDGQMILAAGTRSGTIGFWSLDLVPLHEIEVSEPITDMVTGDNGDLIITTPRGIARIDIFLNRLNPEQK